ncbi:hypothetical protein OsI_15896 [Oryza sativa Indica Group]|uniref:Uncharacterized protein n=1 Tax=Oryza sativa subsp. indica TaxID=39946 RepID=A2XTG3_ORYSI|nr:hypothetical protein OsI_15896 [Oryza sativa Indica Group]
MCSPPSRSRAYAASGGTGGGHYRSRCLRSCSCDEHSRRRRHLYLVLDDWKEGYSLHKLDLSHVSGDGGEHEHNPINPRRLPTPLLRLGFRTLGSSPRVGALGSKIVFIDTATAAVDVSHHVPDDVRLACTCDAVAAGNRLYLLLLSDQSHFERSPESCRRRDDRAVGMPYVEKVEEVAAGNRVCLMLPDQSERSPPPESGSPDLSVAMRYLEKVEQVYDDEVETADDDGDDDEYMDAEKKKHVVVAYSERLTERWSWGSTSSPPPPPPPFSGGGRRRITGYALHPDGRTIFVSVAKRTPDHDDVGDRPDEEVTFSYDTERAEWARRGGWLLPFDGQAHYDAELDAWVGAIGSRAGPRLVACDVVPAAAAGDRRPAPPPPRWTFCEQPLTFLGAESHQSLGDPKLLPMGSGAFCVVVESAPRGADSVGDGDKLLLRVAVFRAKYGKNGELFMTTAAGGRGSCQTHTYVRSRYLVDFHAPAFWM